MLLMRQFLRENTCKTQLGAKFGARRVKSMFRYCINVGERVNGVSGLCSPATDSLIFAIHVLSVSNILNSLNIAGKGRGGVLLLVG